MSLSRRQSLAVLFAAGAAPSVALAQAPAGWATVDAAAQKLIDQKLVPGVQICVRKQGRTVYSKAFGSGNLEDGVALTPESICKVGSITKQFTAALIVLLAQDGKLGLDDKLARHLPDFPRANDITLRQMLTHTSGLGNYTNGERREILQMMRTDYDTAELLALMRKGDKVQVYEPGVTWSYSNTAYVLLGVIAEKAGGKSYADQARERLFAPNGMTRTAMDNALELLPGRATGYSNDPKAASGFANTSFISMTVPGGAGNVRSTTADLCLWHEALLGGKVLQPAMLKEMLTPGLTNDGVLPKSPDGREMRYGFGLQLSDLEGRKCVAHGGGINGFASDLRTFPDSGVTVSHIFNTDGGGTPDPKRMVAINDFRKTLMTAALT